MFYRDMNAVKLQETLRLNATSCDRCATCRTVSVLQFDLFTMSSAPATVYLYDNCLGTPSLSRWDNVPVVVQQIVISSHLTTSSIEVMYLSWFFSVCSSVSKISHNFFRPMVQAKHVGLVSTCLRVRICYLQVHLDHYLIRPRSTFTVVGKSSR